MNRTTAIIISLLSLAFTTPLLAQDGVGVAKISDFTNVWGIPGKCDYSGNYLYVPTGETGLRIVDISDITAPREEGYIETNGSALWADVVDTICYVADEFLGIRVINIANPQQPTEIGSFDTGYRAKAIVVRDGIGYVADYTGGLLMLDLHDPANPQQIGRKDTNDAASSLALSGNYCYMVDVGMKVIDISDPFSLREITHIQTGGAGRDIVVEGDFAYLADGVLGVRVYDIHNVERIAQTAMLRTPAPAVGISVYNRRMYVAVGLEGFKVISALDSAHLREVGSYRTRGESYTVQAMGEIALVSDGFSLFILDCNGALSAPFAQVAPEPSAHLLLSPYPNPFNSTVTIPFSLSSSSTAYTIGIYDPSGRLIENLSTGLQSAGNHQAVWHATGVGAGEYFLKLTAGNEVETAKLLLTK